MDVPLVKTNQWFFDYYQMICDWTIGPTNIMLQKNSKMLVGYKMFLFTWKICRMIIKLFIVYNMLTCLQYIKSSIFLSFIVGLFMLINSIHCVGYQIFTINFAMLTFILKKNKNSKSNIMNTSASLSSHIRQWASEAACMTIITELYHRTCKKQIHTLTDRQTDRRETFHGMSDSLRCAGGPLSRVNVVEHPRTHAPPRTNVL